MSTYSWKELSIFFDELSPKMLNSRLDYQWGSVPSNWSLVTYCDNYTRDRFITLVQISGTKLKELMNDKHNIEELKKEKDPVRFWYYALKNFSTAFKTDLIAQHKDNEGINLGNIYIGSIYNVAKISANLCMQFSIKYPDHKIKELSNIIDKKELFWEKYAVPIIITVVGGLIVGLILMLF